MGIAPAIWGPHAWAFLHLTAFSESEEFDSKRTIYYKQLFQILQELLPCEKCRNHLRENLGKLPNLDTIQTKKELIHWVTKLHNLVNQITGAQVWGEEEAYQYWKDVADGKKDIDGTKCTTNYWKYVAILLIIVIFVFSMRQVLRRGGRRS
jgi:hypothetical protein